MKHKKPEREKNPHAVAIGSIKSDRKIAQAKKNIIKAAKASAKARRARLRLKFKDDPEGLKKRLLALAKRKKWLAGKKSEDGK